MTTNDLLEALARLRVETGSLACLGCGREHNCSTHGCAILRAAADLIERLTADSADLRKEIEWKDMVIALAQKEQAKAEAERDAAIADLKISSGCTSCKYHCSDTIFCRDCNKKQNCKCMSCSLGLPNWEWRGLPEAPEGGDT